MTFPAKPADEGLLLGDAQECARSCAHNVKASTSDVETVTLAQVGTFRTSFPSGFGCPRQGLAAPLTRGVVDLAPWTLTSGGGGGLLDGLEGFTHVWVIFLFDQNRHSSTSWDPVSSFLRPKVRPPWLADACGKRGSCGVFATRSPHRPNPIGLTVCRIDAIDHAAGKLYLSGVDVVDGSAVLDVKPYHPIDSIPDRTLSSDLATVAPAGSGSQTHGAALGCSARFPAWLPRLQPLAEVSWTTSALDALVQLQKACRFYPDYRDTARCTGNEDACGLLQRAVEEVIGLDPRTPQSRSKGKTCEETTHRYWAVDFDNLSIAFRLAGVSDAKEAADTIPPQFEIVKVIDRQAQGTKQSKAWLHELRATLEEPRLHHV